MRLPVVVFFLFCSLRAFSQKNFSVQRLSLPSELSYYDNQFSGLYIHDGGLYFLSESRLPDKAEAKLYRVSLADLERKMADSSYILPYKKFHIYQLDLLQQKMKEKGDVYEGLEAMVIDGYDLYLSVETATPSANCYLLKGHLNYSNAVMDPEVMVTLPKPTRNDRRKSHIYNAGFEALGLMDGNLFAFFEYNYFPEQNYAELIPPASFEKNGELHPVYADKIPFRITDMSPRPGGFTAINYFFKGGGDDSVYRVPRKETSSDRLIRDSTGTYRSYCRLVDINFAGSSFTWKTLWEFPEEYFGYNWEGLAAYKDGFFIMNDKYTPAKPYSSVLLYIKATKDAASGKNSP